MLDKLPVWILATVLLAFLNFGYYQLRSPKAPNGESWTVSRVLNGQTLVVRSANGQAERVRLLGIAAPWREQEPWGDLARQRLEQLVTNQSVILEYDLEQKDRFDRLQAYVWQGNTLINAELVKTGYVVTDFFLPNVKYENQLKMLESEARILEMGLWRSENPMRSHPRDFRRDNLR